MAAILTTKMVSLQGVGGGDTKSSAFMVVAAEAWFLKAEAAMRGWAGAGDIQNRL